VTVPEPLVTGGDAASDGGAVLEESVAGDVVAGDTGTVDAGTVDAGSPAVAAEAGQVAQGTDPSDEEIDAPAPTGREGDSADFRMAVVSSVTLDLPSQHPQVCLRELESPRRQLTFAVGMPDAVALAHAQRRIPTPRPLTHELMGEVLQRFDIDVVAVRIVGRLGAVHFAELDLRGRNGRSVHSCRPTDALILALHQPVQVPILIDARLLEGSGDVAPPGSS